MEIIKNKCFSGHCVHAVQGSDCMRCNSKKPHSEGRNTYIYPVAYEDCDCDDYEQKKYNKIQKLFNPLLP